MKAEQHSCLIACFRVQSLSFCGTGDDAGCWMTVKNARLLYSVEFLKEHGETY